MRIPAAARAVAHVLPMADLHLASVGVALSLLCSFARMRQKKGAMDDAEFVRTVVRSNHVSLPLAHCCNP